jgi:hypothetical protein
MPAITVDEWINELHQHERIQSEAQIRSTWDAAQSAVITRAPAPVSPDNVCLMFLANLINERESNKAGYALAVRWLCLRDDLKEKYLSEAQHRVQEWWDDEKEAQSRRDTNAIQDQMARSERNG